MNKEEQIAALAEALYPDIVDKTGEEWLLALEKAYPVWDRLNKKGVRPMRFRRVGEPAIEMTTDQLKAALIRSQDFQAAQHNRLKDADRKWADRCEGYRKAKALANTRADKACEAMRQMIKAFEPEKDT